MKAVLILVLLFAHAISDMSIDEAWQRINAQSSALVASEDDLKIATLKKDSAKSMYLPSISMSGTYTHLDKPIGVDISKVSNFMASLPIPIEFPSELDFSKQDIFLADLHLLYPLYTGGKIDAAQDIYKAKEDEAQALHKMAKDKEFLNLVKIYYGVVVSESLYKTKLEFENSLNLHYQNTKKLKEQGQIAKVELLNAKVQLDSAKIQTTKAKHKYEIVKSALKSKLDIDATPSSSLFINEDLDSQTYYTEQTISNYPMLNVLDAKSKESESFIKIKEADWLPSVAAFGNYNLYKDDSPMMKLAPQWFAGVSVKIDLLQRQDRSQEVQAAKLLRSKVLALKSQAQKDLQLLVEKTYKEMLLYKDEYESLSSSLELAHENFKLRELAFKEGLSTSVEVVEAQMFLSGAKTKRLNAAYNYVQKVSQLCVLSGDSSLFLEIQSSSKEVK